MIIKLVDCKRGIDEVREQIEVNRGSLVLAFSKKKPRVYDGPVIGIARDIRGEHRTVLDFYSPGYRLLRSGNEPVF